MKQHDWLLKFVLFNHVPFLEGNLIVDEFYIRSQPIVYNFENVF